ncbi:hypothetical protein [Sphingomonas sp. KR3-1]|uniref:hypothetical protein n=1 Tax=Sphingomonas sp. KR3-1 TaxID=3156611 RepID=UPI0032B4B485
MRALKLILALLPLAYLGWLLFHFTGFQGWSDGPLASGLGPTVIGLGALAMLFSVGLIARLLRTILAPRGVVVRKGEVVPTEPGFDADAALDRYLARKAAGLGSAEIPEAEDAPRPVFGRKIG